jgi:hypothetical protein
MDIKQLDREERYQDLAKKYPAAIKRWCDVYGKRRVVDHDGALVFEATAHLQDLTKAYVGIVGEVKDGQLAHDAFNKAPWMAGHRGFNEFFGDACGDSFHGMSPGDYRRELRGETSTLMQGLEHARQELEKTGLKEALEERMVGTKKKRRRALSEHDGDWELDRKFDSCPFFTTITARREFPYLEFIFPIAVNCSATAEEIARFGARSLALAEIFEKAGYRVALTAEAWLGGNLKTGRETEAVMGIMKAPGRFVKQMERIIMRGADEYGDIASFSSASGVEFFRRICFASYAMGHHLHGFSDKLGTAVDSALGSALSNRPVPAEPGQVVLTQDLMRGLFSTSKEKREEIFQTRVLHTISSEMAKAYRDGKAS